MASTMKLKTCIQMSYYQMVMGITKNNHIVILYVPIGLYNTDIWHRNNRENINYSIAEIQDSPTSGNILRLM